MTRFLLVLLTVLSAVMTCAPRTAIADWEFAKWGMSDAELVAASEGKATTCTEEACMDNRGNFRTLLWMPTEIGGIATIVSFGFDRSSKRLVAVSMRPKDRLDYDRWLRTIRLDFNKRYGKAKEEHFVRLTTWEWQSGGDLIAMTAHNEDNPDTASLIYLSPDAQKKETD